LRNDPAPATQAYLRQKLRDADWLLQSLVYRERTIVRVMRAIVRLQRGFFDQGVEGLRPLTLEEIAAHVGVHVSTVQRAVAGKYVDTPHGVYEIAYFFPSGVGTVEGGSISSVAVQARIRTLVALEDRTSPLSDSGIMMALRSQGVAIARETVKKYRTGAGLPPRARRRSFRMEPRSRPAG
jgi:RNA polymerase sigma-54 factor